MITVSKTVDVDIRMADIRTSDLIQELQHRGISVDDEYDDSDSSHDISIVDERALLDEVRFRGFFVSKFGVLSEGDIQYLLNLIPSDTRPGSDAYFVYEKLRDLYING